MARKPNQLPEGTDAVIDTDDYSVSTGDYSAGADAETTRTRKVKDKLKDEARTLKGQAADKARGYARDGKSKATSALGEFSAAMENAAGDVDSRLGEQYGEYARIAASAVSGFALRLEEKDVDELLRDAQDLVRRSPVIAIGVAAVAGFAVARLIKSGLADEGGAARA